MKSALPSSLARLACLSLAVAIASAPVAAAPAAAPKQLTVEQAVAEGLSTDPGVLAATLDAQAARARAADAKLRMLPSLAVSGGYTRLSQEPTFNLSVPNPTEVTPTTAPVYTWVGDIFKQLGSALDTSLVDSKDVRIDLQYPIFAGFRIREASAIATLQALGKDAAAELTRRAMTFEIKRAYWESLRAQANVETLQKALEIEAVVKDEVAGMSTQGMATDAEKLAEDARYDQATLALDDATSGKELAVLVLSSLVGDTNAGSSATVEYSLVSVPGSEQRAELSDAALSDGLSALVERALAGRSEVRAASLAVDAVKAAQEVAKADLYPTLSLAGSVSYADPDPRLFPPQDAFNLSWAIGARLRYDIGGLPGAIQRGKAADADYRKARADLERQRNMIALDARKCALALKRARNSLTLTKAMVAQAEEASRAAEAKYENGLARRSEMLQAEMALLRANLAVESKLIDVEIAQADLARACALD